MFDPRLKERISIVNKEDEIIKFKDGPMKLKKPVMSTFKRSI